MDYTSYCTALRWTRLSLKLVRHAAAGNAEAEEAADAKKTEAAQAETKMLGKIF